MVQFRQQREAKEFLVQSIVSEAEREGVFLSELERKMLYFSESEWTLPNMAETVQAFEREYDSDEYEKKVKALITELRKRLQLENEQALRLWSDAVRTLSQGDHYLLVMIRDNTSVPRPPYDLLKLFVTAVVAILIAVGLAVLPALIAVQTRVVRVAQCAYARAAPMDRRSLEKHFEVEPIPALVVAEE